MRSEAYISGDRLYRYWLFREWDTRLPRLGIIGCNPSRAAEQTNDPTIRKDIGFAVRLGFGALLKVNIGAYRCTDPRKWRKVPDPIGPENSADHIAGYLHAFCVERSIAAWGKNGNYFVGRCEAVVERIPDLYCFGRNNDGTPRHPLMLPYSTQLERFS